MIPRLWPISWASIALVLTTTVVGAADKPVPAPTPTPVPAGKKVYEAQGKRDPFTPLVKDGKIVGGKSDAAVPELMGILWDPDNPIAMLGDKELTVGDTIDDYKIVEIHETSVILEDSEGARLEIKQKTF